MLTNMPRMPAMQDIFTSLTGASKPHHMVDGAGVVLGYSHFGMLAAARWNITQTIEHLRAALQDNPGFQLKIIGHSLGGGTAALFTMMCAPVAITWTQKYHKDSTDCKTALSMYEAARLARKS